MIVLILLLSIPNTAASTTEKKDVQIDPEDDEFASFTWAKKGDKVDVKVTSDIPVNVYIILNTDYSSFDNDYSKAKKSEIGKTSTSFSYKIPDDQTYYLVIYNPSNSTTATVDYSYTDFFDERLDEASEAVAGIFGMAAAICAVIVIAVIVVIVLIIYFLIRSSSRKKQQQYPYPPPGQGSYPPQPPPQQPPVDQASHPCPTCKSALTLVPQYNKWYCERCGKYP